MVLSLLKKTLITNHEKALRTPNFGSRKSLDPKLCGENRVLRVESDEVALNRAEKLQVKRSWSETQRREFNARESLNTRDEYLSSLR
jgi:hypothetical protein